MDEKLIPFERSFSLRDARKRIEQWLAARGLAWEITVAGVGVRAARCVLRNREGIEVASGLGKGSEDESVVGSLFESAEHLCSNFDLISESSLRYLSGQELQVEAPRLSLVLRSMLDSNIDRQLPCLPHHPLCTNEAMCDYPVALFLPSYVDGVVDGSIKNPRDTFNYNRLGLYSTNSGIAIGMNSTESLIHGLLESIERDTISRFLVRAFLLRDPSSLRRVDEKTLPPDLQRLRETIQCEISAEVQVFEIYGRFDVPVFCTWIDRSDDVFHPHGFGCSLCSVHAIRRSLHEAAQAYFSVNFLHDRQVMIEGNSRALRSLEELPFHHRCAVFDMGALSREISIPSLQRVPIGAEWTASQGEWYLKAIISRIRAAGHTAFSASIVEESSGDLTVTHSFTSEQDHFFTVLNGLPSMPSSLTPAGPLVN